MKRISWIDSCRFLAMFWILIGHFLAAFYPEALRLWEPGPMWWLLGGFPGKLAFTLYFVLLGYFASSPKRFSLPSLARYTFRRYFMFAFFGFAATLLYLLGGYAVTWIFHTPDEGVFRIISDGPHYNLIFLLRDGFLLEDHYIDSFWCMPHLLLASVVCRLFACLPERVRPGWRAAIALVVITLLLCINAAYFIWVCVALMGGLLRLVMDAAEKSALLARPLPRLALLALTIAVLKIPIEEGPLLFFIECVVDCTWMILIACTESVQRFLSRPPLPRLGKLSMGIFVIHTPVYSLLYSSFFPLMRKLLPDALTYPICFCLGVSLSIFAAWLLHLAYDALLRVGRKEAVPAR